MMFGAEWTKHLQIITLFLDFWDGMVCALELANLVNLHSYS